MQPNATLSVFLLVSANLMWLVDGYLVFQTGFTAMGEARGFCNI
jgi:hypothetical protein